MNTHPVVHFKGNNEASCLSVVFTENLHDMLEKVDDGSGSFPAGFFHTSTHPHEETCYYNTCWTRDAGRGLIVLSQMGFAAQSKAVSDWVVGQLNMGDHWGRTTDGTDGQSYETDGNALILLGLYNTWKYNGKNKTEGLELIKRLEPVMDWVERSMEATPYGALLPCRSEMSGNPNTDYSVLGLYPNYAMREAVKALSVMAEQIGMTAEAGRLKNMEKRLTEALDRLLIVGYGSHEGTLEGCWRNGLDARDGLAYEYSQWDGTSWPIYHWTRQVPFILQPDSGSLRLRTGTELETDKASYRYLLSEMEKGYYFRKYGFVSNTAWSGMGGRHDETMCGYGQGFFTQAALLNDDVNCYSKLLRGIALLAYDGEVTRELTYEMNPWVMHECFDYERFESGEDHTFGVRTDRYGIGSYPGDEGNLVQEAEILKALMLVVGVESGEDGALAIIPRLPWEWSEIHVEGIPFVTQAGESAVVSYSLVHDRAARVCSFSLESSHEIPELSVRLGPFPRIFNSFSDLTGCAVERTDNAVWLWLNNLTGRTVSRKVDLW